MATGAAADTRRTAALGFCLQRIGVDATCAPSDNRALDVRGLALHSQLRPRTCHIRHHVAKWSRVPRCITTAATTLRAAGTIGHAHARVRTAERRQSRCCGGQQIEEWLATYAAGAVCASTSSTTAVDGILRRYGIRFASSGLLTRTYTGTVSEGISSVSYRGWPVPNGQACLPQAPVERPTLPRPFSSKCARNRGARQLPGRPARRAGSEASYALNSCSGASNSPGALRRVPACPVRIAAAYDFQTLLDQGARGQTDTLALVEFSNYSPSNVVTYQSCYGTSVPITDVAVGGGTTSTTDAGEVELDEEVAATAAPGLNHIYTYVAPNDGSSVGQR